jgi:hypothetical protein
MRALVVVVLLLGCGSKKYATFAPASQSTAGSVSRLEAANRAESNADDSGADASSDEAADSGGASDGRRLNSLSADKAVRHRRVLGSWRDIVATDDSQYVGQAPGAPPAAQPLTSAAPKEPEKLVVEAWLDLVSDDVGAAVEAIRARVEAGGGRVVSENVQGSGKAATSAALELRVPPAQATGVTAWIGTLGKVTSKRVLASEVSKTLFDQELALKNLMLTMERLQKLAAQSGPVVDLLRIENEMTRVRGEIEKVKGEQRWLIDRVEFATITIAISRTDTGESIYEEVPEARINPGPQLATLTLFDPGMRQRTRLGGGASIRVQRYATFELDVFPRGDGGDSRAVLATFGAALYSSYLRDGHRRYFNPYVGGRVGYGYLSGAGSPVIAGELGCELFKHQYLVIDVSLRALAFVKTSAEAALHGTLGVSVPF